MAKSKLVSKTVSILIWITGVLVSLAVGFGMINKVLTINWIPEIITQIAGWIVVIMAIVGVILAIIDRM